MGYKQFKDLTTEEKLGLVKAYYEGNILQFADYDPSYQSVNE